MACGQIRVKLKFHSKSSVLRPACKARIHSGETSIYAVEGSGGWTISLYVVRVDERLISGSIASCTINAVRELLHSPGWGTVVARPRTDLPAFQHNEKLWSYLQVQQWQPYVFIYCQNEEMVDTSELAPLLKYGGEVVHLKNIGRESHSFLTHIIDHHNDLADYTLFSQDIPDFRVVERFEVRIYGGQASECLSYVSV